MMFYTKIRALDPYKNKVLFAIEFTKIVFQQNYYSWSYSRRMIILGTIPCPLPAIRQCFDAAAKADAGAVRSSASQNRRSVRQNIIPSTEGR